MQHRAKNILACSAGIVGAGLISTALASSLPGNEYLEMDIAQLMQVTITSVSKKPQKLSESATAVFVITLDDIHRAGVTSVPEALRLAPGLHVARIDANKWAVTSRGFGGSVVNKLLVMIDGRTVYDPSFAGVFWDAQDTLLEDIDRIEVIRGPGATVWGANAVNGVINIITKNAATTQGALARVSVGNEDRLQTGMRYGGKISETTHGRAYVTYKDVDSFTTYESGEDSGDEWDSLQGGFRLDGELENSDSWTLQGDAFSNNENQTIYPFWLPDFPYVITKEDNFDYRGWNLLGRYEKDFSSTEKLSFQAFYDYTNRDEVYMEHAHKTFDLELQYQDVLGEIHNMIYGLGYRRIDSEFENTFHTTFNRVLGLIPRSLLRL